MAGATQAGVLRGGGNLDEGAGIIRIPGRRRAAELRCAAEAGSSRRPGWTANETLTRGWTARWTQKKQVLCTSCFTVTLVYHFFSQKWRKTKREACRTAPLLLLQSVSASASLSVLSDHAQRPLQRRRPRLSRGRRGDLVAAPRLTRCRGELSERLLVQRLVEHALVHAALAILSQQDRHDAHLLPLPLLAGAPPRLLGRERGDGARRQRGHVGARQRAPEHRHREHEVHLPRPEPLGGGKRGRPLVEVERVGVAHEEGRRRAAAAAEDVGDGGELRARELLQRAVSGDDPGRRRRWPCWLLHVTGDARSIDARNRRSHWSWIGATSCGATACWCGTEESLSR
ncbi:hypothetical protein SETIT_1G053600v2 [Setaria italica]|uniref:Uncharacterized protein n=1 Tax=Setaria italica TaxID=4555 RepID=A0A368PHX4_SETIT|nr:hypothetical protein SETIT_1G053600v2 [Setaria italica]